MTQPAPAPTRPAGEEREGVEKAHGALLDLVLSRKYSGDSLQKAIRALIAAARHEAATETDGAQRDDPCQTCLEGRDCIDCAPWPATGSGDREDATRWRFLRDNWPNVVLTWCDEETGSFGGERGDVPLYVRTATVTSDETGETWQGDTPDAAVDAALRAAPTPRDASGVAEVEAYVAGYLASFQHVHNGMSRAALRAHARALATSYRAALRPATPAAPEASSEDAEALVNALHVAAMERAEAAMKGHGRAWLAECDRKIDDARAALLASLRDAAALSAPRAPEGEARTVEPTTHYSTYYRWSTSAGRWQWSASGSAWRDSKGPGSRNPDGGPLDALNASYYGAPTILDADAEVPRG